MLLCAGVPKVSSRYLATAAAVVPITRISRASRAARQGRHASRVSCA